MKPLFYFKNPEFKFIGFRFFFPEIFLLLFHKGTYDHDMDEILIYSSGENNLKTNLKTDHEKYRVREKAEVYLRNFMTVYTACYFIFNKRVRNRVIASLINVLNKQ